MSERLDPDKRVAITAVLDQLANRMTTQGLHSVPSDLIREIVRSNPTLFRAWNNDYDSLLAALLKTGAVVEQERGHVAFVQLSLLEHFAKSYLGLIDQVWTPSIVIPPATVEVVRFVDQELVRRLAKEPRGLYRLPPRDFEKLIAELFRDRGWSVELTKATRDGGADIIAVRADGGTHIKMLIEAKRFGPDKAVGVSIVRQLSTPFGNFSMRQKWYWRRLHISHPIQRRNLHRSCPMSWS